MKILHFIATSVLFFLVQGLYSQDTMRLEHFDEIALTGIIEVTLLQGNEEKVVLTTDNFDRDDVMVRVEEGTLIIKVLKSLVKDAKIEIQVTYQQLRRIKANAGAMVTANNPIVIDKLDLKANSGAEMELQVEVNKLKARLAEGAQIHLSGTTESQTVTASTGAIYDAYDLQSDYTYVNANTGASAEVIATKSIEATANTGGQVEYKGEPENIKTKDFLGGGVENF